MQDLYKIEADDFNQVKERLSVVELSSKNVNNRIDSLEVTLIESTNNPKGLRSIEEPSTESINLLFLFRDEHEQRLLRVENRYDEVEKNIEKLISKEKKREKEFDRIMNSIEQLSTEMKELGVEVKEMRTEVKEMRTEVKEMRMEVKELRTEVEEQKTAVSISLDEQEKRHQEIKTEIISSREEMLKEIRINKENYESMANKFMQTIRYENAELSKKFEGITDMFDERLKCLEASHN